MELASFLNSEQLAAVEHREGPLLVIAGAGSGKTRVIEYRVLNLIMNLVDPRSILLLTFTRRAAKEMLQRAAKRDPRAAEVEGGTFHAFGVKLLREFAASIGVNENFTVLDQSDAEEALHRCATDLKLYEGEKRFPQKSTLQKIVSMATNKRKPVAEITQAEYPNFAECAQDIEKLRDLYAQYKLEKSYFDYDDLLLYTRLLLNEEPIRVHLGEQYRYIMVDEFQDTNVLQGEIVKLLGSTHGNVMVVGDDAQSIYGFRGAYHQNILDFPQLFKGAKVIKLESNYRSSQQILDLGNSVLNGMEHKFSKHLRSAEGRQGQQPSLSFFKDPSEEAVWVVDRIQEFYHEGESLFEMAVLFRSSYLSFHLQTELAKRRIPFDVFGGKKFSDTAHVKDLLAYLKIVANPKDELAWNRVLMLMPGVGPKTARKLMVDMLGRATLVEMKAVFDVLPEKTKYKVGGQRLVKALAEAAQRGQNIEEMYIQLLEAYLPLLEDQYDNWPQRKKDLEMLAQIAGRYESLEQLLTDFALEPPDREVSEVSGIYKEEGRVTLSTIHSSKGLEWGNVFMIGMIEGIFPSAYALKNEEGLEEERRLFYVAVTRAKDRLFLSLTHYGFSGGITQFNKPSRFLDQPGIEAFLDRPDQHPARREAPKDKPKIGMDKDQLLAKLAELTRGQN
ncbi:MAG: ATP-dependent helicase [bacterium]|nr:ATP-dependent helicase [bacterium]